MKEYNNLYEWYRWGKSMYGGYYLEVYVNGQIVTYRAARKYGILWYAKNKYNIEKLETVYRFDNI